MSPSCESKNSTPWYDYSVICFSKKLFPNLQQICTPDTRAQVSKIIYRLIRKACTALVFHFERLVLISNVERIHSKMLNRKQTLRGESKKEDSFCLKKWKFRKSCDVSAFQRNLSKVFRALSRILECNFSSLLTSIEYFNSFTTTFKKSSDGLVIQQ